MKHGKARVEDNILNRIDCCVVSRPIPGVLFEVILNVYKSCVVVNRMQYFSLNAVVDRDKEDTFHHFCL